MATLSEEAVIITGSGGGIGEACARAAAAAGARVVINDINASLAEKVAAEIRAVGGSAIGVQGDVSRAEDAQRMVDRCVSEFGFISGLVNNAGIVLWGKLEETSLDDLKRTLEVNVMGTFNCTRAAIKPMLAQGRGSIVNITSGAQAGMDGLGNYGASKGAIAAFTYGWAGELRGRGVRVNAVSPMGVGGTAPAAGLPDHPAAAANAPIVLYLLSGKSKHVTGQILRSYGPKLSLMSHPAIRAPILENDRWTIDSVAKAFDDTLSALMLPTNVAVYEIAAITSVPTKLAPPGTY